MIAQRTYIDLQVGKTTFSSHLGAFSIRGDKGTDRLLLERVYQTESNLWDVVMATTEGTRRMRRTERRSHYLFVK